MELLPSIASANLLAIGEELKKLENWEHVHFDIEDGVFTPNITFGMKMFANVSKTIYPRKLDVHMMVSQPMEWISYFSSENTESLCTHIESLRFPLMFLNRVRQRGIKAGLALNFTTSLEAVEPFLPDMDYLLVMTSEPDANGEHLNSYAFEKALKAAASLPIPVYADGGLGEKEVLQLAKHGAAGCILGRAVFSEENPLAFLRMIKNKTTCFERISSGS